MSIFGSILSKVFGGGPAKAGTIETGTMSAATGAAASSPEMAQPAATPPAGTPVVDVEALLSGLAAKSGAPSNWQTSIVDMMKLLDLDSSLASRKQLAEELHYSGDTNDSATMNVWLHKQVMQKLAENGGKVPDSLQH
jgi:hypothetical protein